MHNDPRDLIVAMEKAIGRNLDADDFEDRLAIQKGCYILNQWGYGSKYSFSMFIRGPYSSDLDDDYRELGGDVGETTCIPDDAIGRLRSIFGKGMDYVEAYATVLLIKESNRHASAGSIRNKAINLKPYLRREIEEASALILARGRRDACCGRFRSRCRCIGHL